MTSVSRSTASPATTGSSARTMSAICLGCPRSRARRRPVSRQRTPVEEYLRERGIALPDHVCGRVIRFHPACPFSEWVDGVKRGWKAPAMIARFTPIFGGDEQPVTAIHRTELLGGDKRGVKMMLGSVLGQVIKLDADEDVTVGLALGEGIESTLAFSQAMRWRPAWAASSRDAIAKFPVLPGIEALTVAVDHDASKAGQEAADEARRRWQGCDEQGRMAAYFCWHMP